MRALLLAAGYGTRLRPITEITPKCLVTINSRPLLSYWLDILFQGELERLLINTHHLSDKVEDFVRNSEWSNKIDIVYENNLLGTAGTILQNKDYFGADPFFVAHADNLTKFNFSSFLNSHKNRANGVDISMMTFLTDEPDSCGIVIVDNDGIVRSFTEKPKTSKNRLANAAAYIFEPGIIEFLGFLREQDERLLDISYDIIPNYIGKIQEYRNTEYHRDIGTLKRLSLARSEFVNYSNLTFKSERFI